ncbi:MAG: PaaI family thioesterase [Ruminococcus sp.]|nr:PaaI family thioesterase [Ruminococcus sp.]
MGDITEQERLEEVRRVFEKDRFATENGAVIDEIGENYAKCSVELTEHHRNAWGGVMGGLHCTLADFAFAVATNMNGMNTVGLSMDVSFIGMAKGSRLIAEAVLVKDGRTICTYHVTVKDELENIVADVKCMGFHKQ